MRPLMAVFILAVVAAGCGAVLSLPGLTFTAALVAVVAARLLSVQGRTEDVDVTVREPGWRGDLRVRTEQGTMPGTRVMVVMLDGVEVERSPECFGAEELRDWSRQGSEYLRIERVTA